MTESVNTIKDIPLVWLVLSDKLGDNAQAEIIAESLGLPYEIKRVYPLEQYIFGKPRFRPSLYHIDLTRSDALEPPWPDLIITIGRRSSMVAMWIRKQSDGKTRIVLLGRPKRQLGKYALVIATSQYRLPDRPNVLHLDLPLMRGNEKIIAEAAANWQADFAAISRPIIALMVGGPTKPYVFNAQVAHELISQANRIAAESGGTLYVTTSRRTPQEVVKAIQAALPDCARFYHWGEGGKDNPYLALLGLAEYFIVTGDSISMMVEVARLGKPLAIFPLPVKQGLISQLRQYIAVLIHPVAGRKGAGGGMRFLGESLYRLGVVGYSRDLTAVHRLLIDKGLAVKLGEAFRPPGNLAPDELPKVVGRIKGLLSQVSYTEDGKGIRE